MRMHISIDLHKMKMHKHSLIGLLGILFSQAEMKKAPLRLGFFID